MITKPSFKHTKIIATIGPASRDPQILESVVRAGANAIRLNMSHGSHDEHHEVIRRVRKISEKLGKPLAIIIDLQGPKVRLGELPGDGVVLKGNERISFKYGEHYERGKPLPMQHDVSRYVQKGQPLYLRDGMIQIEITGIKGKVITGKVLNTGIVFSKQGINLPDTDFGGDIMTNKDVDDAKFAAENDVDYVALSFVQSQKDILNLRKQLTKLDADCGIIAKIETKAAASRLKEVIASSDGVMVARGDLSTETRPEQVPVLQKRIIDQARECQKFAIVATQMLESMVDSPQPTRAEVSDVSTAVVQGADAVMLSAESAVGKYPRATVALMDRIIKYTEAHRLLNITASKFGEATAQNAISAAAITLAKQIDAKLIIAETFSGRTARNLCSFRPETMVIGVTPSRRTYQQLALVWGARSYLIKDPTKAAAETVKMLREEHSLMPGDKFITAAGRNPGVTGGTDTLQLQVID